MSDELTAASERYAKHKASKSTGESPYHVIEDGALFTNLKPMLDDLRTLADAYLSLAPRLAEMERKAAAYDTILKVVRPKREREPDPRWMDWVVPTARCDTFEEAIEHQATKELAEMQHRMRAAVREEMRNPTEPSKGET